MSTQNETKMDLCAKPVSVKVTQLREDLRFLPSSPGSASFVGRGLVTSRKSFFPGGSGLGLSEESHSKISTIVLGSDWGTLESFKTAVERNDGDDAVTVDRTDKLLARADFNVSDCWYSNAWPVLRKGEPEKGYHPMCDDIVFTNACRLFLRTCIEALSPRLIVTMGKRVAWFVGPLAGERWELANVERCHAVTSKQMAKEPVERNGIVYAAITHPSLPNEGKRATSERPWSSKHETALLQEARKMAGIASA